MKTSSTETPQKDKIEKMNTIVVTGGAGFIGSHLSEKLLERSFKVICIDNLLTGALENVESLKQNPQFTFIEQDVIKPLAEVKDDVLGIFHLASPASPSKKSKRSYINYPIETLLVNSQGTYNVLELAKEKKSRFVYASTSEVYGNPTISPQREDYFGNVNPVGVRSPYDEGKRFGEALSMAYFRKFGVDARVARIFNTYGERIQKDDGRVISNFINQALDNRPITVYGDGTQTRSFCYIEDMIDGFMKMLETEGIEGEVINLGSEHEYSILEIAKTIKDLTASTSEIVFEELPQDDPLQRRPAIEKARKLLSWGPKTGLEEGLRKTIEYFKKI